MEITTSERALLGLFMAKIHRIDPDVLVVCSFTLVIIQGFKCPYISLYIFKFPYFFPIKFVNALLIPIISLKIT